MWSRVIDTKFRGLKEVPLSGDIGSKVGQLRYDCITTEHS
jgi:hypothetical protein